MFYLEQNGNILTADSDKNLVKNFLDFVPGLSEADIKEGDIVMAYDGKYYLKENAPIKPDEDIVATRISLYNSISDSKFQSYNQGGGTTLDEAIKAKALIQFNNKKSYQTSMTLDDFISKITKEYYTAEARKPIDTALIEKYTTDNEIKG